jgi:DNA-binding NtrC family response regulator
MTGAVSFLVVDDEAPVRLLIRAVLAADGHEVVEAVKGEQAMTHLSRRRFDVAITDIFMAEKDGYELILEARRLYPGLRVIAVSGGGTFIATEDWDPLRIAARMGADETLAKPFNRTALRQAVARCLHGGRAC